MSPEQRSIDDIAYIMELLYARGASKVALIATLRKLFRLNGREISLRDCKNHVEETYE